MKNLHLPKYQFTAREIYVYQSRMCATLFYDVVDPVFLSEILFTDEFDFQTVVAGDLFGADVNFVTQKMCPLGEIEYTNAFFDG